MTSKTIPLSGEEIKVEYSGGANAWLRNDGTAAVYASGAPGISAGADGVASIPAGKGAVIYSANGTVYLKGTGSVLLVGSDYSECPFYDSAASGGSGADEQARAAIEAHAGNADVHVTSAEKALWNGKADKSDIPDKLPADGGNAATLGSRPPSDYANDCNEPLDSYLSGQSGDIRALAHLLPHGGFNTNTDVFCPNITFPISGNILLSWNKSRRGTLIYGILDIRAMDNSNRYTCSITDTDHYSDWQMLLDGGNAASVGTYTEEKIAALEARIAALEGGR